MNNFYFKVKKWYLVWDIINTWNAFFFFFGQFLEPACWYNYDMVSMGLTYLFVGLFVWLCVCIKSNEFGQLSYEKNSTDFFSDFSRRKWTEIFSVIMTMRIIQKSYSVSVLAIFTYTGAICYCILFVFSKRHEHSCLINLA